MSDQKRFPDNGFIAALWARRQFGWKLAKVQCGVWASLVQGSIQGEADIGYVGGRPIWDAEHAL